MISTDKHLKKFIFYRPEYKNLKIYDILNFDKNYNIDKLQTFINEEFENNDHKLKNNYVNLLNSLGNYSSFNVLEIDNKIIGFSGLQSKCLLINYNRVITRTYLSYKYRSKGISYRTFPDLASGLMLPYQTEIAEQNNIKHIFFSIEGFNRKKYSKILAKNISEYTKNNWTSLEGFYNTCRLINNKDVNNTVSCWQNIVYLNKGCKFELPHISDKDYLNLKKY